MVIDALRNGQKLLPLYAGPEEIRAKMAADADGLREVLVSAIAGSHPDMPSDIPDAKYAACCRFLAYFKRVYTLNYDLLLYWAGMSSPAGASVRFDDGFRNAADPGADFVVWDPKAANSDQNIFYVHGGLHLFDSGAELVKYTWSRTGIRLIEQVRAALAANKYPLFVAEGRSDEKLSRIRHHSYLGRIERSFLEIKGSIVTFGVSFGESDQHVMDWITEGKLESMYVGIFGDPRSEANEALMARAKALSARRQRQGGRPRPLAVAFYDAASAQVWG